MTDIVKGLPSTHGDSTQLNTTTLIRHAARTYPEQEIVYRTPDGGWDRYTYADCYTRLVGIVAVARNRGAAPAGTSASATSVVALPMSTPAMRVMARISCCSGRAAQRAARPATR